MFHSIDLTWSQGERMVIRKLEAMDFKAGFFEEYLEGLRKKGSGIQWLIYENQLKEFKSYFGKYLKQNTRARLLTGFQRVPVATIVLRDRVQISLVYPDPTIIEIRNKSLADEYQKYFNLLWKKGVQIRI